MSKENQKMVEDGQNRCRRCDRPISNPNAIYGWRCAQIVGANKYNEIASMLEYGSSLKTETNVTGGFESDFRTKRLTYYRIFVIISLYI